MKNGKFFVQKNMLSRTFTIIKLSVLLSIEKGNMLSLKSFALVYMCFFIINLGLL